MALDLLHAQAPSGALDRDALQLAQAWCLVRTGDPEGALQALPKGGELADYAAVVSADALVALGREDEALDAIASARPPGESGQRLQLMRGRLLATYGDPEGASQLEALFDTPLGPEARFWLAEARGIQGDVPALVEGLQSVWTDARPGGWDTRAGKRLEELGVAVPDLDSGAGRALAEARLDKLHTYRRTTEAQALADSLFAGRTPEDHDGHIALGHVYFAARAYPKALEAWKETLGEPAEATGSAEELFDYALCHARTDDYDTAAVVYKRLLKAHPTHKKADFASFKLGYMKFDRGECDQAIELFADHRERFEDTRYLDEALWFEARCHWRAGARDRSVQLLDELARKRPRSSLVPGAAYWKGRALGLSNDADGEKRALQRVMDRWPASGYAWFAAARLGTTFPAKPAATPPEFPKAWASKGAVQRSLALLDVGLRAFARDELDTLAAPSGRKVALPLAWARLRAGDYQRARKLSCPYASDPWKRGDAVAQQACLPRPEHGIVKRYADEYGLDPAVAYGVMWAESALAPGVTSAVGARGLMQLMPDVGGTLHEEIFPGRPYSADDLYLAPYNAALGATELGQRGRSLKNSLKTTSVPAVVASYNAGEEAVRRWIDGRPPQPFDDWSEDVSYTETRRYIKAVLGHVMRYRWLYGDEPERP